ncbi:helix-turn-helix domain-containing protein [Dyadobacter arcticus]|uniref:AraC-like DNA-binding protein n=1 Tax=Dyadobacter arcticus TaxID=1078754 RepID=A0ABX0UQD7_9BACT|nr:AraC family transcriptional regulator [Dyadobacter arcticus]NIJ55196.1 AraC-like DNA-binding protein [Dyadobacter arcticus]
MKRDNSTPFVINSISQQHQILAMPKPLHPLVSILKFEDFPQTMPEIDTKFVLGFYTVTIKKNCACKIKYGQSDFDFDEGVMSFFAPNQVFVPEDNPSLPGGGWLLSFHPDFIRNYSLEKKIKDYGFFHYAVSEALILSEREELMIENIFANIDQEYYLPIDNFSQDVMVAQLELLLTYSHRFYKRQFNIRRTIHSDLLSRMEVILSEYFNSDKYGSDKLPTVIDLAKKLNLSPKYLSDALRNLTGQSAQQHIHDKLIEKAKQILTTTNLSVSEIAYTLGFEYPQSFNRLFKNKTKVSPLEFRRLFN